ncbi:MAG: hypothetical protein KGN84_17160 [Acidobacteriota bacterium]|nr:hypothetical protein [Acidobacteriota bacterium]
MKSIVIAIGVLTPMATLVGQNPIEAPASGLHVVSTETFAENLNYAVPLSISVAGAQLKDGIDGGQATTIQWRSNGETDPGAVGLSVLYRVSYENNAVNSRLGGFSHDLRLSGNRKLTPRLALSFTGAASSSTFLSFATESPLSNSDALASPLRLALGGFRQREGEAGMTLSYEVSPRAMWAVRSDFMRQLPATSINPVSGGAGYPGASLVGVGSMYVYKLSPRSSVSTELDYAGTYSAIVPNSISTASMRYTREVSTFLSAYVGGGYSLLSTQYNGVSHTNGAPLAEVGAQWKRGSWSLQGGGLRSAGDSYGLGASSRLSAQLTLGWSRPTSPWILSAGGAYEHLRGAAFPLIRDWLLTSSVGRKLSRQTELRAEFIWTSEVGSIFTIYPEWNRRGARISFIWFPNSSI